MSQDAWYDDIGVLRKRLNEILSRAEIIQAIAIASPSLESAIATWKSDPSSKKGTQAERSLVRYFMRMAGRPTPFGLFAGISLGTVQRGNPSVFRLAPRHEYRSATRLDFDFLFALTAALQEDRKIRYEMHYEWNASLHFVCGSWQYIESQRQGTGRSHHLIKLAQSEYLNYVLGYARPGGRSFSDLAQAVHACEEPGAFSDEEVENFLHELIDSEILIPDILPALTSASALDDLLARLRSLPSATQTCGTLESVRNSLFVLDQQPLGRASREYRLLSERLEALPIAAHQPHTFQVDMLKPVLSANLDQSVLNAIVEALEALGRFAKPFEPRHLDIFRRSFAKRYEQEWIPLTEVLDLDCGIGYGDNPSADGSSLLRGITIEPRLDVQQSRLNELALHLFQKVLDCARDNKTELEITLGDLPPANSLETLLPDSFCVVASLLSPSAEALERGDFKLLYKGGAGPSSARMFGRFCTANPKLTTLVRASLESEQLHDPGSVYAEVVYLPEGRVGNVLCRPVLRDFEIVCLGRSGAPSDRQISIDDLFVTVRAGKIVLYSQSLRREIIPRISNAHVVHGGLSNLPVIYRFLFDLQRQGGRQVPYFSWGPLDKLSFLPRVCIGRVILAGAQWRLSEIEIESLMATDRHATFMAMKAIQSKRSLPRWVTLSDGDNTLPVDLDNPLSVDAMVHLVKRSREATIIEMYPHINNGCVNGPEGNYIHEIMIPLGLEPSLLANDAHRTLPSAELMGGLTFSANVECSKRLFPPGGEWHYLKIFGGASTLDVLLTHKLGPLLFTLAAEGKIVRWFFVRYADPELHLRVRIHTASSTDLKEVSRLLDSMLISRQISNIQIDTYQREVERYGGPEGILLSEEIFDADSEASIRILQLLEHAGNLDFRWRITLAGVDRFLMDCGFEQVEKVRIIRRWRDSLSPEYPLSTASKSKSDALFRAERRLLRSILIREPTSDSEIYSAALQIFEDRSRRIQPIISKLRALEQEKVLSEQLCDIVGSYVHMHVNRMIQSSPREHENMIYRYLCSIYESNIAQDRSTLSSVCR